MREKYLLLGREKVRTERSKQGLGVSRDRVRRQQRAGRDLENIGERRFEVDAMKVAESV